MALLLFLVPILLLAWSSTAQQEPSQLSPFSQRVFGYIPKNAFNKLFEFSPKDEDDFLKAVNAGTEGFENTLRQPTPPELREEFEKEGSRLISKLTPEKLFQIFSNAVGQTLQDYNVLNFFNLDSYARSYAQQLKIAADYVSSDNVPAIGYAIGAANAKFFFTMGWSSQQLLVIFERNLLAEDNKL